MVKNTFVISILLSSSLICLCYPVGSSVIVGRAYVLYDNYKKLRNLIEFNVCLKFTLIN